jgi:hypothetical protein
LSIYDRERHYRSKEYLDSQRKALDERHEIIKCLRAKVSEEDKAIFRENIKNSLMWPFLNHLGYGMIVRNLLRENGFSYDPFVMDGYWISWISEALLLER